MAQHKGFALLEVMLALSVGSILMVLLLQSTSQMNVIFQKVAAVSALDRNFTLLQQQFERDFSGIFLPEITLETEQPREQGEGKDEKKDQKKEVSTKTSTDKTAKTNTQKEETKTTILPHAFFSQNDNKANTVLFTCLTTNPVAVYGEATPRLARVVYRLLPDPEHLNAFMITRQQSDLLDFERFKPEATPAIRGYIVADNIEKLTFEFLILKPLKEDTDKEKEQTPEEKKKQEEKQDAKPKREFVTLKDWPEFTDQERKEKKRPLIPTFIHVTLSLLDSNKRSNSFELWYAPLYDSQPHFVDKLMTLPSTQEMYHRRFAEHKMQEQMEIQEVMRNIMEQE